MEYRYIVGRVLFAVFSISFLTYNSITNFSVTNENPKCIEDNTQLLFSYFYKFFEKNENSKKFLLILIGIILDISIILTSYAWIKFSKSWRSFLIFTIYILIQTFSKFIFKIKIPESNLLEFPGIPSLLITYNTDINNFFPASIGLSLFAAVELKNYENFNQIFKIMSVFSYFNIFLQVFVYLSIRSIYLIDILCPIVSLHYSVLISNKFCKFIDDRYVILNEDDVKGISEEEKSESVVNKDRNENVKNYNHNRESVTSIGSKISNASIVDFEKIEKKESNEKNLKIEMEKF